MIKVGLTGGIGSGKSTACRVFEMLGVDVYYSDIWAKWLMDNNKEVIQQIEYAFGAKAYIDRGEVEFTAHIQSAENANTLIQRSNNPSALIQSANNASTLIQRSNNPGKHIDRKHIADKIFGDSDLLAKINSIVHPAVSQHFALWAASADRRGSYVIEETAILFECGAHKNVDYTIAVTAPTELRIARVMHRDGASKEQVIERIANQMSEEERCSRADFLLVCDDLQLLIPQILDLHKKISSL